MSRVRPAAQADHALESADFALVQRQALQELLVAGAVDDARDVDLGLFGIPVDSHVFLFGPGQADVDHVRVFCVEDVGFGLEVFGFVGFVGFAVVVIVVAPE